MPTEHKAPPVLTVPTEHKAPPVRTVPTVLTARRVLRVIKVQ